ncbi:MAG: PilW family protein [Thermoanaerobaculia bacterium]
MCASRPWSRGTSPGSARRGPGGFTLVELAVVAALTITGAVVLGRIFIALQDAHGWGEDRMEVLQAGRYAAERVTAELRLATAVSLAEERQVEFTAELGSGPTAVRYYYHDPLDDGLPPFYLYRAEGATAPPAGQPLAVLLPSAAGSGAPAAPATPRVEFRYYNAAGSTLTPPLDAATRAQVRLVGVTLTLENIDESASPPVGHASAVLRWAAAVRNMD